MNYLEDKIGVALVDHAEQFLDGKKLGIKQNIAALYVLAELMVQFQQIEIN